LSAAAPTADLVALAASSTAERVSAAAFEPAFRASLALLLFPLPEDPLQPAMSARLAAAEISPGR
jgi:hypothetical protein